MKKFAKLLAMVLAVSMVLTMFVGAIDYTDTESVSEKQAAAIQKVYEWGIMNGYGDGTFGPKAPVQRDQMAKIMYALKEVGLTPNALYGSFAGSFADAAKLPGWSKDFVGYAAVEGIFKGYEDGEFKATGNVTYIEAAIVLLRALGMEDQATDKVPAEYTGSDWYTNALKDAMTAKLFNDIAVTDLRTAATRADIAVMIGNAYTNNANTFKLATTATKVITGITEVGDAKVKHFVFDGTDVLYPVGDAEIADYIGKEASFSYEGTNDNKTVKVIVSELALNDAIVEATAAVANIKREAKDGKYNLTVGDTKINGLVGNEKVYYYVDSVAKEHAVSGDEDILERVDAIKSLASWKKVTVIYNPITKTFTMKRVDLQFGLFDETKYVPEAKYDEDTKEIVVTYKYDGKAVADDYSDLANNAAIAYTVVDDTFEIVGYPQAVSTKDIVAAKKASNGTVYTTVYIDDVAMINNIVAPFASLSVKTYDDLYTEQGKDDYIVYYYENLILAIVAKPASPASANVYGLVKDWSITKMTIENKVYNVAIVNVLVNGEAKTILANGQNMSSALATAKLVKIGAADTTTGLDALDVVSTWNAATVTAYDLSSATDKVIKVSTDDIYDDTTDKLVFIDLSGNGYEAADYKIDKGLCYVDGALTTTDSLLAIEIGNDIILVYDPAGEFGDYKVLLPEA